MLNGPSLFCLLFIFTLVSGCDVSESLGRSTDTSKPYFIGFTPENKPLLGTEVLKLKFSEAMDPDTVSLQGSSLPWGTFERIWNASYTEASLTPNESWPAGTYSFVVTGEDRSGLKMIEAGTGIFSTNMTFQQYQPSEFSIDSIFINQTTWGNPLVSESGLWIASYEGNSLKFYLTIPDDNDAPAYTVRELVHELEDQSQPLLLSRPQAPFEYDGKLLVTNQGSNQVFIFNEPPKKDKDALGYTIGSGSAACEATSLSKPEMAVAINDRFYVVDGNNNRILIWNEFPEENSVPDIVLGQSSFTTCAANDDDQDGVTDTLASARTLSSPSSVWTDGQKLLVLDSGNNRLLLWNQIPDESFIGADVVLGQADFMSHELPSVVSDNTLSNPYLGLTSNGRQILVTDTGANRVLIWNEWPSENNQSAEQVLGQSNFTMSQKNDDDQDGSVDDLPTLRTLNAPSGVSRFGSYLLVTDSENGRVLVFKS